MRTARVKNWSTFQHYKDRSPPWIKLHRRLLDNLDYHRLNPESAKALPLIWIIASEDDGYIPACDELAFRLRTTPDAVEAILNDLIRLNFLGAAQAEQDATQNQIPPQTSWPSRHIPNKVRIEVFQRDNGCCVWCGSDENVEFDHVTPVSKGGESTTSNLQLLCRSCNRKKRTRDAAQSERLATQLQCSRSPEGEGETERETEERKKSAAPKKPARAAVAVELQTWLDTLEGMDAIPTDDPIFEYAEKSGIPLEFLELSWRAFVRDMRERRTRKRDWRAHYRNAVRRNWYKLWWFDSGVCKLTTCGVQEQRVAA